METLSQKWNERCNLLLLRSWLMHKLPDRFLSQACNCQRKGSHSPLYFQIRLVLEADTASMPQSAAARQASVTPSSSNVGTL